MLAIDLLICLKAEEELTLVNFCFAYLANLGMELVLADKILCLLFNLKTWFGWFVKLLISTLLLASLFLSSIAFE